MPVQHYLRQAPHHYIQCIMRVHAPLIKQNHLQHLNVQCPQHQRQYELVSHFVPHSDTTVSVLSVVLDWDSLSAVFVPCSAVGVTGLQPSTNRLFSRMSHCQHRRSAVEVQLPRGHHCSQYVHGLELPGDSFSGVFCGSNKTSQTENRIQWE